MNEELNTNEFESWLKSQADKHRMYPSDQLWRNINQQIHGTRRWPALTFGAILTGALVTATLIFLRPDKNLFNLPIVGSNTQIPIKVADNRTSQNNLSPVNVKTLQPVSPKEVVYSFNYPVIAHSSVVAPTDEPAIIQPENETLALNEPVSHSLNAVPSTVIVNNAKNAKPLMVANPLLAAGIDLNSAGNANTDEAIAKETATLPETNTTVTAKEETAQTETIAKIQIKLPETKKKRWNIEVYGGPNINYRYLTEKRPYDYHLPYNAALTAANRSIVSNVVKQKPSVGFNIGGAIAYSISNRLRVKAGLQFNYRQYTIDAFRSKLERSVLLLNNSYFYPDSVYTYSVISNEQGNSAITFSNRFFQLSTPVGIEWTAAKIRKIDFNLASSIQPTYQLNSNVYQITSDYKSYIQAPGLLRRWNVNAAAEATANFMAGGLQWQVGPQIRYQMMPSQKSNYSIHEHLIDYGVRVGIVKQF